MWENNFFKHESFVNLFDKTKRFPPIRDSNNTDVLHNKRFLFFLTLSLGSLNNIPVQKAMRKTFIGRSLAHRWPTFLHGIAAFHHVLFIRIHSWKRIHTSSFFSHCHWTGICILFYLCLHFGIFQFNIYGLMIYNDTWPCFTYIVVDGFGWF